jgi:GNAT superfamily N-acetyltransferase
MQITVRQVNRTDLPVIKELFNAFEAWLNTLDEEPSELDPARADALEPLVFGPDRLCEILVAEDGGEIVGYLAYYFGVWIGSNIAPCLHIADLFVRDTHQRHGIGRAMMEHARKIARQRSGRCGARIPTVRNSIGTSAPSRSMRRSSCAGASPRNSRRYGSLAGRRSKPTPSMTTPASKKAAPAWTR